ARGGGPQGAVPQAGRTAQGRGGRPQGDAAEAGGAAQAGRGGARRVAAAASGPAEGLRRGPQGTGPANPGAGRAPRQGRGPQDREAMTKEHRKGIFSSPRVATRGLSSSSPFRCSLFPPQNSSTTCLFFALSALTIVPVS